MRFTRGSLALFFCLLAGVAGAQYLIQQPSGGGFYLVNAPGIDRSQIVYGNGVGTTGAVTGILVGATGKTTYLCGFDIAAIGGTSPVGPIVISGLTTPFTYQLSSQVSGVVLSRTFTPCLPSSTTGTSIIILTTAAGAASAVDVNSWGFLQ